MCRVRQAKRRASQKQADEEGEEKAPPPPRRNLRAPSGGRSGERASRSRRGNAAAAPRCPKADPAHDSTLAARALKNTCCRSDGAAIRSARRASRTTGEAPRRPTSFPQAPTNGAVVCRRRPHDRRSDRVILQVQSIPIRTTLLTIQELGLMASARNATS